jgi:DHA1 family tetracycline resistance protein-like MFS transporter
MLGKSMYETLFSQHAKHQFGFGGHQIGWMLSYIGVMSVLVNVFVLKRVGKRQIAYLVPLAICQAIGLLAWGVSTNVFLALAAMAALTLSSTCFTNVLDSQMSELASSETHGSVMGFCASLDRVTRVVAPSLGGMVLQFLGPQWLGAVAALATLYSVVVLAVGLKPPLRTADDQEHRAKRE